VEPIKTLLSGINELDFSLSLIYLTGNHVNLSRGILEFIIIIIIIH